MRAVPLATIWILCVGLLSSREASAFELPPSPSSHQEQAGAIQDIVSDAAGTRLPGVVVEARETSRGSTARTTSGADGVYRSPALSPGTYAVAAMRAAFAEVLTPAVVVSAGQCVTIDITLSSPGSAGARARPALSISLLDVRPNAAFAGASRTTIERFPAASRDVTSILPIAPGARTEAALDGGMQIEGAAASDGRYFIDGMDVTGVRFATSGKLLVTDVADQVQVKSSGFGAEFAGATGSVVSVVTRSGSNTFSGSAATYFESDWLLGDTRSEWRINPFDGTTGELVTPSRDQWRHNSPAADIGGPLLPGRAWFHAAYGDDRNDYRRAAIFRASPPPFERREFRWYDATRSLDWNVSAQPGSGLRVKVTGSSTWERDRGSAPSLQPNGSTFADGTPTDGFTRAPWDSDPVLFDERWNQVGADRPESLYSAQINWVLSPSLVVNVTSGVATRDAHTPASYYGHQTRHEFAASNVAMTGVPDSLKFPQGYVDQRSTTGTVRDSLARLSANASLTWFHSWFGTHAVQAGLAAERVVSDENSGDQEPDITLTWDESYETRDGRLIRGQYGYYQVQQPRVFGRSTSHDLALWLQDSWAPADRWTIDLGVRVENEHTGSYTSDPGLDWGLGDRIAPRLAFAYGPGGRGRSKVYGSYGWFYDTMKLVTATRLLGAVRDDISVYTLDTYDWLSIDCAPAATGCPGTFIEQLVPVTTGNAVDPRLTAYFGRPQNAIDPAIEPARTGEFTLGFEQVLGATTVGARYVHKWLPRAVEDIGVTLPGVGDVTLVGNPGFGMTRVALPDYPQFPVPRAVHDYDAIEFTLDHRARTWSLSASYVRSALRGNYSSAVSADDNGMCPMCTGSFESPYASWDRNGHEVLGVLPTIARTSSRSAPRTI